MPRRFVLGKSSSINRFSQLILTVALFPIFAFGARPIATITSAEPFSLDGYMISTPGVTSYPLVVGDRVSTKDGSAVLVFREGSRLKLGTNSSVHITGAASSPKIILLGGALDYKLVAGSILSVTNLDTEHKLAANQAAVLKPDTTNPPAPSANQGGATGAATPNSQGGLLTNPKFLIPAAGILAAGLAAGLLSLPPVSRHL